MRLPQHPFPEVVELTPPESKRQQGEGPRRLASYFERLFSERAAAFGRRPVA